MSVLGAAILAGTPALAAKRAAHTVTCKAIKDAIASGKSADEVAKDLKVSETKVKNCTATPPAHHKRSSKKPS
jgi:hypothetical protein